SRTYQVHGTRLTVFDRLHQPARQHHEKVSAESSFLKLDCERIEVALHGRSNVPGNDGSGEAFPLPPYGEDIAAGGDVSLGRDLLCHPLRAVLVVGVSVGMEEPNDDRLAALL